MSTLVTYQDYDKIALITMDDGKANAVSPALLEQLHRALDEAEKKAQVVVLTGRPGKFSAGFDLGIMGQGGVAMGKLVAGGAQLAHRLLAFPTPVVAACNGHGLAMGAFMLLSADYRVGAEGAFKIGLNEVAIGLTMPLFGVELGRGRLNPVYLSRAVINAEVFSAGAAVEAGFLDQVVAQDNVQNEAMQVAAKLAMLNMAAHHATKLRVREPMLDAIAEAIEKEFGAALRA